MAIAGRCTCASCGGESGTDDYCDCCGAALQPAPEAQREATSGPALLAVGTPAVAPAGATAATAAAGAGPCPTCASARAQDDAFCEVCGLDFTTGELPMPPAAPAVAGPADHDTAAPSGWTVVVEADRAFFRSHGPGVTGGLTFPEDLPQREVELRGPEVVVGRRNEARGSFPDIDLSTPVNDPAVSRRHAVLRREPDGSWTVVDQHSVNGTWVNGAPVEPGRGVPLHDGDCLHVGVFSALRVQRDAGPGA